MSIPKSTTRIFCLRHLECKPDSRIATLAGETITFAAGHYLREVYGDLDIGSRITPPQSCGIQTDTYFMCGYHGHDLPTDGIGLSETDDRLAPLERAIHFNLLQDALNLKVLEMLAVIDELAWVSRDHMMLGLHSPTIDNVCIKLRQRLDSEVPDNIGAIGGAFDHSEGFIATFVDARLTKVETIRLTDELKACAKSIKPSDLLRVT